MKKKIAHNVKVLGDVVDLETETINLAQNFNRKENLILTEKPAIAPNTCYKLAAVYENEIYFKTTKQKDNYGSIKRKQKSHKNIL